MDSIRRTTCSSVPRNLACRPSASSREPCLHCTGLLVPLISRPFPAGTNVLQVPAKCTKCYGNFLLTNGVTQRVQLNPTGHGHGLYTVRQVLAALFGGRSYDAFVAGNLVGQHGTGVSKSCFYDIAKFVWAAAERIALRLMAQQTSHMIQRGVIVLMVDMGWATRGWNASQGWFPVMDFHCKECQHCKKLFKRLPHKCKKNPDSATVVSPTMGHSSSTRVEPAEGKFDTEASVAIILDNAEQTVPQRRAVTYHLPTLTKRSMHPLEKMESCMVGGLGEFLSSQIPGIHISF